MTDFQTDAANLNAFAGAAAGLAGDLRGAVPPELTTPNTPEIGQSVSAFTDAGDLYRAYDNSRLGLVGTGGSGTDAVSTLITQLGTLGSAAKIIASNYLKAHNEDYDNIQALFQALSQTQVPQIPGT